MISEKEHIPCSILSFIHFRIWLHSWCMTMLLDRTKWVTFYKPYMVHSTHLLHIMHNQNKRELVITIFSRCSPLLFVALLCARSSWGHFSVTTLRSLSLPLPCIALASSSFLLGKSSAHSTFPVGVVEILREAIVEKNKFCKKNSQTDFIKPFF